MKPEDIKAFYSDVAEMRTYQKRFFETKDRECMRLTIYYEKRVDKKLKQYKIDEGPTLFEDLMP